MTTAVLMNKFQKLINKRTEQNKNINKLIFGQKMGLISKLFGCWHENLSRPFNYGKTAYRSCLQCGARKQFNPDTFKTVGNFYFPSVIKDEE